LIKSIKTVEDANVSIVAVQLDQTIPNHIYTVLSNGLIQHWNIQDSSLVNVRYNIFYYYYYYYYYYFILFFFYFDINMFIILVFKF